MFFLALKGNWRLYSVQSLLSLSRPWQERLALEIWWLLWGQGQSLRSLGLVSPAVPPLLCLSALSAMIEGVKWKHESLKENWWFLAMLVVGPPLWSRLKYIYYIYISITRIAMKFWYRHAWSPEAKPSGQNFHLKYFNIYWLAQHFALFSWFWLSL